jgi:hypothetical protein
MRRIHAIFAAVALALAVCSCADKATTPSDTTPASPDTTETWTAVVPVGGSSFYSFSVARKGTVNLTYVSAAGDDVPSDIALSLGIGTPSGTSCTSNVASFAPATAPQVTGTYDPGVYCAKVTDAGTLPAAATIVIAIAHP